MTMRILDKLYASDTNLTKADLALLEYIKVKGLDACNAPISEIAKSCGVSHATVTRFARKFGFDSLQAFKIALAQELGPSDNQGHLIAINIAYDESSEVTARKLDQLSTSTIHHTVQLIDHDVLRRITQRLTNAKRGARAALEQSEAYRQAVQTQLVATIANSYYNLLTLDRQLDISLRTLDSWTEIVRTYEVRKRVGEANEAAVAQALANKLSVEGFRQIIEKKDRCSAGTSAPGNALFLVDIGYPDDLFVDCP